MLRSLVQQSGARLGSTVISFVAVAITSRYLGPADYGLLTSALAFVSIFSSFTDFGFNAVIARRVAADRSALHDLVSSSFTLSLVYCLPLAAAVVGLALAFYGFGVVAALVAVLGVYLAAYCLSACFMPLYIVEQDFRRPAVAEVVVSLVTLVGAVVIGLLRADIAWFAAVTAFGAVLRLLMLAANYRARHDLTLRWTPREWMGLIREAFPIGVTTQVAAVYSRVDVVALSLLSSAAQVGYYSLGYRIISIMASVPNLLVNSAFFSLADASRDRQLLSERLGRALRILGAAVLPLAIGGFIVARELAALVGGAGFEASAAAVRGLFVAFALTALNTVLGSSLTAMGRQRTVLICGVASLVSNLALLVPCVLYMQAAGAAVALILSEALATAIIVVAVRRRLSLRSALQGWPNLVVALVAMSASAVLLRSVGLLAAVSVAGLVYCVTFAILERSRIAQWKSRRRGRLTSGRTDV